MKQYTTPEQTAKLIELGFEKPKGISGYYTKPPYEYDAKTNSKIVVYDAAQYPRYAYSIGELIETLPENVAKRDEMPSTLNISLMNGEWCVQYADYLGADFEFCNTELIDALYAMVVKLKEEGVI
jgi:hypothetical protein